MTVSTVHPQAETVPLPPAAPQDPQDHAPSPHPVPSVPDPVVGTHAPDHPAVPAEPSRKYPYSVWLTILHLAALGLLGLMVLIGVILPLISVGIGLVIFGVGLVLLIAAVYVLHGISWFESQRVAGLYRLDIAPPQLRARQTPTFGGWLRSVLRQSVDGRMWRGVAHFGIASVLGLLVLLSAQGLIAGVLSVFTYGVNWWWQPGLLGALLCAGAIPALALLHRVIAIALIGAPGVEEQLTEQVRTTDRQRAGAVRAADVERTRIERDLHDGVQPRLVSVGMTLGLAQEKIDTDPDAAKALVAEAHTSTKAAITELRQLARGIYASVLDDRGLDAALSALAGRSHVPVRLDVRQEGRCSRDAEAAVYFAIAETLTNAAKHSRASEARVTVRVREDEPGIGGLLWARIEDNGAGGARFVPGGGLDGVRNRVLAAGGTTRLDSPQGGPTLLEVSVPCAS